MREEAGTESGTEFPQHFVGLVPAPAATQGAQNVAPSQESGARV